MTAVPAAPGTAPGGGAQEAATPLHELADFWEREYVTDDGWPAVCARQLREKLRDPKTAFGLLLGQKEALAAGNERLRELVRDILQSMPDTADEQEWRARAGALGVTDPDGEPYRAYTEDDL